ncbi:alpha/beta hydrolase [Mucilaginibacter myungsuensis]|uniref:Esterase family protein n=1 Tax=Mucilaginibacter myungsuensis TaxID=649104 RepID=A0A929KVD7_9SPHI|nr:alpha/beta hydrolase-fold protein [Mucilaginibacter myungsuensis]MBE9662289.1 esterase family protein [Mucilaginibacter myungsuensis]MDN3599274.1 alpha/beta hydrolase-fold protein [Mucilaginibacter myungsuensis]
MNLCWPELEMDVTQTTYIIASTNLGREVTYTIFLPEGDLNGGPVNLLLMNDGQDAEALNLKQTLQELYDANRLKPTAVVAINCGDDRIQEYGVAGNPDFKKRGAKADLYTAFIIKELLPQIKKQLDSDTFETVGFAGFSLGGLSALDIAWNNPEIFDVAGVFSGSLWWRSKDIGKGYTEADRIMHRVIRETKGKPNLKFWFQTGTKDETSDRNGNGIIDAIDDTTDLIKELQAKGYTRDDITYVEMVGGEHNPATWAKAMPKFLVKVFGK